MSQVKLFSSSGGARVAKRSGRQKKQKVKKPLKTLAIWLLVILCLEGLYFFCIYTNNSFVKKWRTIYINTAMDTMRHQWLATYFIPKDVIDEVRYEYGLVKAGTVGKESTWGRTDPVPADQTPSTSNDSIVTLDPNVTHETDQPDAEELTQETFFRALDGLKDYDGKQDVRAWLFTVARNAYYDHCRRAKHAAPLEDAETKAADSPDIAQLLVDKDAAFTVHQCLHALEEPYKEVFSLRVFGELSLSLIHI